MYSIHTKQKHPITIDKAWEFFSDPKNLNIITPESMKFVTLSGDERKMFTGQIKKFDKDLKYTKKWVPELETSKYPKPIVDHKEAREKCLRIYKEAVG